MTDTTFSVQTNFNVNIKSLKVAIQERVIWLSEADTHNEDSVILKVKFDDIIGVNLTQVAVKLCIFRKEQIRGGGCCCPS
jgi:hypothetical protein